MSSRPQSSSSISSTGPTMFSSSVSSFTPPFPHFLLIQTNPPPPYSFFFTSHISLMENNNSNSINNYSYPDRERDSTNSSPRSFDDHSLSTKLRLMCSYGGKIHPNPNHHTHYLTYTGGDTKFLSVDRSLTLSHLITKLSSLSSYPHLYFKYQLPGEDLDSLVSVTNDDDLELMVLEYDRLFRTQTTKPPRLRLFIFPLNDTVPNRDWVVDELGFGRSNPDFLSGLDKGSSPPDSMASDGGGVGGGSKDVSDCGSEDRSLAGDFPVDVHRRNALLVNRKLDISSPNPNPNSRVYTGNYSYYGQKLLESVIAATPATVAVPVPVLIPVEIMQERHVSIGAHALSLVRGDTPVQPVYYILTPTVVQPVTGQVGHPYYTVPGVAPGQILFGTTGMPTPPIQVAQPKVVAAEQDGVAVGLDASGRCVYYTAAGGVAPVYKVVAVGGGALSAENKVAAANVNRQN